MKKKLFFILIFMMSFLLYSCNRQTEKEEYAIIKEFSIDENICSNFIYQQNSILKITGKCVKNGKIIASLYDENAVEVSSSFGIGDDNGDYEIYINTPKGSFMSYSLVLHDSNNRYYNSFYDILFGEITLLLGDEIINDQLSKELSENTLDSLNNSLYILDMTKTNPTWESKFESNDLSEFIYNYYNVLKKTASYKNMPIAFVNVMFNKTNIIEWLSLDLVKNNQEVLEYLQNTNQYLENPYLSGQMSYVSSNILSSLFNYSYGSVIYSAGVNDFIRYSTHENSEVDYNVYSKLLLMCLKNIYNNIFSFNTFAIFQSPSCNVKNVELLRNVQAKVSKYIKNAYLIPTYDFNINNDDSLPKCVLERYYEIVNGKKEITDVANVIKKYDNENLSKITIEFSNTSKLNFSIDSLEIIGINNEAIVLDEDKIIINNNSITIDLSYYSISFENSNNLELHYYNVSSISYAYKNIFEDDVALSDKNLPILPFFISINSLDEVK